MKDLTKGKPSALNQKRMILDKRKQHIAAGQKLHSNVLFLLKL